MGESVRQVGAVGVVQWGQVKLTWQRVWAEAGRRLMAPSTAFQFWVDSLPASLSVARLPPPPCNTLLLSPYATVYLPALWLQTCRGVAARGLGGQQTTA